MNLQKTYSSLVCVCIQCWQYSCAHLRNRQVERVKLVTWQPQQTTRRTSWAEGLHRAAVVSACYLNVLLAVKTEWLGHGRKERCAVFRQQHIVGWYNVHTGIFTRLNCVSAGLSIKKKKKKIPTAILCSSSLRLSQSVRAVVNSYLIETNFWCFLALYLVGLSRLLLSVIAVQVERSNYRVSTPFSRWRCSGPCIRTLIDCHALWT